MKVQILELAFFRKFLAKFFFHKL